MSGWLAPLLGYVFVTTFTPGPNNITSAAYGSRFGLRGTLSYLLGIFTGFVVIMAACALLTELLTTLIPRAEPVLRWVGAAYMVWLAVAMFLPTHGRAASADTPTFAGGLLLQIVNVKVILYGLSVFSGYLAGNLHGPFALGLASIALAVVSFVSITTWTVFGSLFRRALERPWVRWTFNGVMALLLVWSALSVVGVHLPARA